MASRITGAQFVELDGNDHCFFASAQQPMIQAIKLFVKLCRAAGNPGNTSAGHVCCCADSGSNVRDT